MRQSFFLAVLLAFGRLSAQTVDTLHRVNYEGPTTAGVDVAVFIVITQPSGFKKMAGDLHKEQPSVFFITVDSIVVAYAYSSAENSCPWVFSVDFYCGYTRIGIVGSSGPYLWSTGSTDQSINVGATGNYSAMADNCTAEIYTFVFTNPSPTAVTTPAPCGGTGAIDITVTGGTAPYTYSLGGGTPQASPKFTGLPAGPYTITTTDAHGCTGSVSATVTTGTDNVPPTITCVGSITIPNAPGKCGGNPIFPAATATDNCGVPTVVQVTGSGSGSFFPVGTSTVAFRATDGSSNTATCSFTITIKDVQSPTIMCPVNTTVTSETPCGGWTATFASATAMDNCGTPSLSQIAGPASGSFFSVGMTTVVYKATDASGNTATCSFIITVNPMLAPTISQIIVDSTGNYKVTLTYANGCTQNAIVPTVLNCPIMSTCNLQVSTIAAVVTCNGANNGSVWVTSIVNGSAPFTFKWSNGATTQNLGNLAAGTYTVTVTDSKNCTATASATVSQPTVISISGAVLPATCGQSNGGITLAVSGGTQPFTFKWSNGATTQNLGNLASGTYTVTVTDTNGCTKVFATDVTCTPTPGGDCNLNGITSEPSIQNGGTWCPTTTQLFLHAPGNPATCTYTWSRPELVTGYEWQLWASTLPGLHEYWVWVHVNGTPASQDIKYCFSYTIQCFTGTEGTESIISPTVKIFPNPTTGKFTIDRDGEEFQGGVSEQPAGIYIILNSLGQFVGRLIKQ